LQTQVPAAYSEMTGPLFSPDMTSPVLAEVLPWSVHRCQEPDCSKVFKMRTSLNTPIRRHKKDFRFSCPECLECYFSTEKLKEHKSRAHSNSELQCVRQGIELVSRYARARKAAVEMCFKCSVGMHRDIPNKNSTIQTYENT
jgi:hypothetical protein